MSGTTSSEMEMGMYYTRKNVFRMLATWEFITIKDQKKVQVDNGGDSTVLSTFIWIELGKPQ